MTKEKAIKLFQDQKVRVLWNDEQKKWYFSVVDVIKILTESKNPRKYWSVLKTRLKKEGSQLATNCSQLKMEEQKNQLSSNIGQLKALTIGLLIFLFITFHGNSQETSDSVNIKLKSGARELIHSAGICTLITLDENGESRARAMDPFSPENDFTIWFGTNAKSRKVEQINNDSRVTLYYLDSDGSGYVTIQGIAALINDSQAKEKWWKEEWTAFYPNKEEDYLLIKVTPKSMEVLSPPRGINNDPVTWTPPTVVFETK